MKKRHEGKKKERKQEEKKEGRKDAWENKKSRTKQSKANRRKVAFRWRCAQQSCTAESCAPRRMQNFVPRNTFSFGSRAQKGTMQTRACHGKSCIAVNPNAYSIRCAKWWQSCQPSKYQDMYMMWDDVVFVFHFFLHKARGFAMMPGHCSICGASVLSQYIYIYI